MGLKQPQRWIQNCPVSRAITATLEGQNDSTWNHFSTMEIQISTGKGRFGSNFRANSAQNNGAKTALLYWSKTALKKVLYFTHRFSPIFGAETALLN